MTAETLLQISDPHFGTEQSPVVAALVALVRAQRPDVVVFSGDITQRARRAQFQAARAFADALQTRWVAIPGNHDIPLFNVFARVLAPYSGYRRAFAAELEPELESAAFFIVCVNTTRPSRHKDGAISAMQIERVAQRLRHAPADRLRIVVIHQPMLAIRQQDELNLVHGHEAAACAWSQAGADIVMGGHIHLPYIRSLHDRFGDLPRRVWAVQAGTAVSRRIRDAIPNSVNLLRYAPGARECAAERWDFDASQVAFSLASAERLPLDR